MAKQPSYQLRLESTLDRELKAESGGRSCFTIIQRVLGLLLGAALAPIAPSFAAGIQQSEPFSLHAVEDVCNGSAPHFRTENSIDAFLRSNGWVRDAEPQQVATMAGAILAMTYNVSATDNLAAEMEHLISSERSDKFRVIAGDVVLLKYRTTGGRLTVGLPLVGSPLCAVTGSDQWEAALSLIEFYEIDTLPIDHRDRELTSEPTRRMYRSEIDDHYAVFMAIVDKQALRKELLQSNANPDFSTEFVDAIPRASVVYLHASMLN